MEKNKLDKIQNKKIRKLERKLEIKFKELEEIDPKAKRKPFFRKHIKTCMKGLLLVIKTKICARVLYSLIFIMFLFLVKALGLMDVFKLANEFLIKTLECLGDTV